MIESKKEIGKNIYVYKNQFKDVSKVLDIIKKSESQTEDFSFSKWKPWGIFGTMSKGNFFPTEEQVADDSQYSLDQKEAIKEIREIYFNVSKDYMSTCGDSVDWPHFVDTLDLESEKWRIGSIDVLKHFEDPTKNIAMHYHTDQNWAKMEDDSDKFLLTITMYLNDDHEGGELSFVHYENDKMLVTTLTPEAGDITVFPSFYPYYHGVLPITKNNKYLIRTFYFWEYGGSKEWLDNQEKYGKDVWEKMEKERLENLYSKTTSQQFYNSKNEGQNIDHNTVFVPEDLPKENITYINGKDLLN
jgi:signal peptidase I